jgi:hypothetical protein
MRPLGRGFLRLNLVVLLLGLLAWSAAAQTEPTTLEGEDLFAFVEGVTVDFDCDPEGTSTVSFTASGLATGPYPGTFEVIGSLRIGPQTVPGVQPGTNAGEVLNLTETFTIFSADATISGTKKLQPDASIDSGTLGTCQEVTDFAVLDLVGDGTVVDVIAQTQYQATIHGPDGTFTDSGLAFFGLSEIVIRGACPTGTCTVRVGGFDQLFSVSDQLAGAPEHSNGGGLVPSAIGGKATFAFHARNAETGPTGGCNVVDRARHVRCLTVTLYVQEGNEVMIQGEGTDDGLPMTYEIRAADNGEPGTGQDTFEIETSSGFSAGGVVTNGEVQVR